MIELISLVGGGLFRLVPNILTFFKDRDEAKFELRRMDKQADLERLSIERLKISNEGRKNELKMQVLNNESSLFKMAIEQQGKTSGIRFLDALNILFRPLYGYLMLSLYLTHKSFVFYLAFQTQGLTTDSLMLLYTNYDRAVFSGVTSFFFVNRILAKRENVA